MRLPSSTKALLVLILSTMSNTAYDLQPEDPAATDGLDHVFNTIQEVVQDPGMDRQDLVQDLILDSRLEQSNATPKMVSLKEAAEISGKARRYLLSLIHKGKVDGTKDDSGAWMVPLDQIHERFGSVLEEVQDVVQDKEVEIQDVLQESIQDVVQEQIQDSGLSIHSLFRELQAATYRNGYLESQLAYKNDQLRLLPDFEAKAKEAETIALELSNLETLLASKDSEIEALKSELMTHQESKWRRFMKWFIGG